ncbi:hypothetical protein JCM11491_006524 [Sporobolomyces phaffii]
MSGSSFVFYRFKSQREPSRIAFDGTAISVWDLKKEIIAENRMGKGADFDFAIYNADTEEEYANDYALIPRSTSVLARRLPPSKPGRGNAQQYMASSSNDSGPGGLQAGRGAAPDPRGGVGGSGGQGYNKEMFTKRFDGREDSARPASQTPSSVQIPAAAPSDEASAMAAMFAATNSQWEQTQEQMAHATPVYRAPLNGQAPRQNFNRDGGGGGGGGGNNAGRKTHDYTHKPPPPGYICYRCGQKGHWIQDCPTNGDAAYENRPRIKRTTGIPKSFLTEVAGPGPKTGEDGDGDDGIAGNGLVMDHKSGVMVTADGGFVVARPDNASWFAHRARTANLSASDVQNLAPTDPDLTCPICSKLLRDAVLTPCCSTSFCDECVSNALLDNDMLCPECETRVKNLDKLKPDDARRERAQKYVDEMVEASKEAAELEKAERERDLERRKKEEDKEREKLEKEAAANGGDVKTEGDASAKAETKPVVEEPVKTEKDDQEELFPAKPQEILNPRKPRNVSPATTPTPISTEMAANGSSASVGKASSPPAAPSPSTGSVPPSMPLGLNAAQQAQFVRQQQLRAQQQQQQMMAMQGMMGMPNPQMIQQQMFQLSAMLQNPALPPPMRMNLQGQLQQCQMMLMQYQQRMAMGMQQQQQQFRAAAGGSMSPQMIHGANGGVAGGGQKRQREEGASEGGGSPNAKRAELA